MPDDVSCPDPDPNEPVTRGILSEELAKFRTEFRVEMSEEIARQLGAYEEKRRLERVQEYKGLVEDMRDAMRGLLEIETKDRIDDHETRISRLEARPAKRVRKPTTRKPRKSK